MANKKFSEFTVKTDPANVDFLVGYDGTDNVRIDPSNLGGGGASSLNGLSDCLVDTLSLYVGEVPSGLSGNPQGNLIVGVDAGNALTSGANNTLLGNNAGKALTTAASNVIIGKNAGLAKTSGSNATIIGTSAGRDTASGSYVVLVGSEAGISNTGNNAIAIGFEAGRVNTASNTISIGYHAGYSQTSGSSNINIGYRASYSNTTGADRVVIGKDAGFANTGTRNVFIGKDTGSGSGSGAYNAVVGSLCLYATNAGSNNSILGYNAMPTATGDNNVAVGYQAGNAMTTGYGNTVIGSSAMDANTDGQDNVAIGHNAMGSATSDGRTVAIGVNALALQNQLYSPHNTAVGYAADDACVTGFQRTCIGANTGGGATGDNITNIGYGAGPSTSSVSNEITLGNSSVTSLRCAVTSITSLSDERDKTEIKDLEYGLAFIDALQPREFVWDNRVETDKDGEEFYSANKGKKDFGFIAQEVQELDNDTLRLVYAENEDKLELSYGKLVPILVKAIQELKEEVELLKS
jgi:hypothetical protein